MKSVLLNLPTFGFIVSTRAALGFGIGLLVSSRVPAERRRVIGATLVAIGAAATIPAAISVLRSVRRSTPRDPSSAVGRDELRASGRFEEPWWNVYERRLEYTPRRYLDLIGSMGAVASSPDRARTTSWRC